MTSPPGFSSKGTRPERLAEVEFVGNILLSWTPAPFVLSPCDIQPCVPVPGDFARAGMFNVSSLVYTGLVNAYSVGNLSSHLAFDLSYNDLSGSLPDFLSISRVPPPLQRELNLSVSQPHLYATRRLQYRRGGLRLHKKCVRESA